MTFLHALFVYICIINVCVMARGGGHGGGSHGGHGHSSHHGSSRRHHVSAQAHYSYNPPSYIEYGCSHCLSKQKYPVYRPTPPSYVFMYKDSGNRYSDILTGLSLYNLARSLNTGWPHSHQYASRPEEICSLQIIEESHFEETEFPCFIISSFIDPITNTSNDSRLVDIASPQVNMKPFLRDKGPMLVVTQDQECVLWHNISMEKDKNRVPCALLNEYAKTLRPSGMSVYVWVPALLATVIAIYLCCECCCRQKEKDIVRKEEGTPLNKCRLPEYQSNN